jgi:hypothetical protein
MRYVNEERSIQAGDSVLVEGGVKGVVVCDFDHWTCLSGYESWLSKVEVVGGASLSSGILVETSEIGMVHYAEPDDEIVFIACIDADHRPR